MRFRERVRLEAQSILEDTGVIDPMEDARHIAEIVRDDPSFVDMFLDDDLEAVIRTTLRNAFPPSRESRQVGSTVASREAIREQVSAKAKTHAAFSIPAPMPPPSYSINQILVMNRVELRSLAKGYHTSSTRDAIIGRWLDDVANRLPTDSTLVGDRFTKEALNPLFEAAKKQYLALEGSRS